eukprot:TRINITY_DN1523_c0_g1_i1.p1 TRINITY_DN1523_c0_g1~~TRINITY_DN1523_c0_g1_i1.p1  ORF type:complete len:182 (+),score=36.64 TRINITY_DN1523_c0_g1_i1:40-585(+)
MLRRLPATGGIRAGIRPYKHSGQEEARFLQRQEGRNKDAIRAADGSTRPQTVSRQQDLQSKRPPPSKPTCVFLGYAEWDRDGRLPHEAQDRAMDTACVTEFGEAARSATWEEYENNTIQNLPATNESGLWLHFSGKQGWGLDNGKGYQWKKCIWRRRPLNGTFSEDSCSASVCSAIAVKSL